MSIAVLCPHCQKRLNAPNTLAGCRAKCPHCAQVMQLPAVEPKAPAVQQPQAQPQEVFAELGSTDPLGSLPLSAPQGSAATTSPLPSANSSGSTDPFSELASPDQSDTADGLRMDGIFNHQQFDEMLADVGTRLDKPHEPKQDRYPCPVCHEMIVRGSKKCKFCGEDFQQQFNSLLPNRGRSTGSIEFQSKMNTLGSFWIGFPGVSLAFLLILFLVGVSSDDPERQETAPYVLIFALPLLFWIALGIATLRKAMWAVWAGLLVTYLSLIGSIICFLYILLTQPFTKIVFVVLFGGVSIQIAIAMLAHRCIELKQQRR